MEEKKLNNSEILFLYDAKECNPNGDPDNENKPRMDLQKEILLVSDVRLKRYIRDYFQNIKNLPIFVSKVDDKTVDATDRFAYFIAELLLDNQNNIKEEIKNKINKDFKKDKNFKDKKMNLENLKDFIKNKKPWSLIDIQIFLNHFIDMRLFGVTLPIKDEQKGSSVTFTGPVQFNWGYSLNKAELIESPSITSYFAGRTKGEGDEGGAIGKDWRVYYSIIAFYGRISAFWGQKTNLTDEDIDKLDEAIWNSIITETNTRTKLNQHPRLYIRIEYNDTKRFIGDLRRYVDIDKKDGLRDVGEYRIDISKLKEKIEKYRKNISEVIIKVDDDIKKFVNGISELKNLSNEVKEGGNDS